MIRKQPFHDSDLQEVPLQLTDTQQQSPSAPNGTASGSTVSDATDHQRSAAGQLNAADFQKLELEFLGSLMPGLIHNLATPLSGVIGATQLLEMRIGEQERLLRELERNAPQQAEALLLQHQKSCNNLEIMSRNARQLTEMLQNTIRRFHRSAHDIAGPVSLFELVSTELQFLDSNLSYKHKVRKRFELSTDPLSVHAAYRRVVAVLDEFVIRALAAHDFTRGLVDFAVTTDFDLAWGTITLEARFFETDEEPLETGMLHVHLANVAEDGAQYEIEQQRGHLSVVLKLPRKPVTT